MTRSRQFEKLSQGVRAEIPRAAVQWLAAARRPLEELTRAALDPEISAEDFAARVAALSARLPALLDELDHDALGQLMEHGMGAAAGNGIAARITAPPVPRTPRADAERPGA